MQVFKNMYLVCFNVFIIKVKYVSTYIYIFFLVTYMEKKNCLNFMFLKNNNNKYALFDQFRWHIINGFSNGTHTNDAYLLSIFKKSILLCNACGLHKSDSNFDAGCSYIWLTDYLADLRVGFFGFHRLRREKFEGFFL